VIACPLALDDIPVADLGVLRESTLGRGDYPVKAGSPKARVVIEAPMVIAEPVDGDGVGVLGDSAHHRRIEFAPEEDCEHKVRLLCLCYFHQTSIHPFLTMLLHQSREGKIENVMAHMEQGMVKIVMLEAVALLALAIVIFHCHVEDHHIISAYPASASNLRLDY
jgi:hypothetical protein